MFIKSNTASCAEGRFRRADRFALTVKSALTANRRKALKAFGARLGTDEFLREKEKDYRKISPQRLVFFIRNSKENIKMTACVRLEKQRSRRTKAVLIHYIMKNQN